MTPPSLRVNTYIKTDKYNAGFIDKISKYFIISELFLGISRISLVRDENYIIIISLVYSFASMCFLIYSLNHTINSHLFHSAAVIVAVMRQCFYIIFNFGMRKRLVLYYNELNTFDKQVGCRPKISRGTVLNIVQMAVVVTYIVSLFCVWYFIPNVRMFYPQLLPGLLCHIIELYYYGHLLSLLVPRLRLINCYMKLSRSQNEIEFFRNNVYKSLSKIDNLMNLYHTIIKAYGFLIEAIKWQLLVTLIVMFINILSSCYVVTVKMIQNSGAITNMMSNLAISLAMMVPLFAPCTLSEQVYKQVQRLRELLATRLYENQLDKRGRGVARALLAWTDTCDLSFSLMRIFEVNTSLPFNFVGLLVTYLVILLQFEKVINP